MWGSKGGGGERKGQKERGEKKWIRRILREKAEGEKINTNEQVEGKVMQGVEKWTMTHSF